MDAVDDNDSLEGVTLLDIQVHLSDAEHGVLLEFCREPRLEPEDRAQRRQV